MVAQGPLGALLAFLAGFAHSTRHRAGVDNYTLAVVAEGILAAAVEDTLAVDILVVAVEDILAAADEDIGCKLGRVGSLPGGRSFLT